mgnify:CR=1 FL=1
MFKNTNTLFDKKKKFLTSTKNKSTLVKECLVDFLKDRFGSNLSGTSMSIDFNSKDNSLIIKTENKIIANELVAGTYDMKEFMKNKKIFLDRIIVQ